MVRMPSANLDYYALSWGWLQRLLPIFITGTLCVLTIISSALFSHLCPALVSFLFFRCIHPMTLKLISTPSLFFLAPARVSLPFSFLWIHSRSYKNNLIYRLLFSSQLEGFSFSLPSCESGFAWSAQHCGWVGGRGVSCHCRGSARHLGWWGVVEFVMPLYSTLGSQLDLPCGGGAMLLERAFLTSGQGSIFCHFLTPYFAFISPFYSHFLCFFPLSSFFYQLFSLFLFPLWRPCSFTPLHSLTGPVGQPFASRPGGQRFTSWGCTHT